MFQLLHSLEEDGNSIGRGSPIHSEINEYIKETNRKPSVTQLSQMNTNLLYSTTMPKQEIKTGPSFHHPSDLINGSAKSTPPSTKPTTVSGLLYCGGDTVMGVERGEILGGSDKDEQVALLSSTQSGKS